MSAFDKVDRLDGRWRPLAERDLVKIGDAWLIGSTYHIVRGSTRYLILGEWRTGACRIYRKEET